MGSSGGLRLAARDWSDLSGLRRMMAAKVQGRERERDERQGGRHKKGRADTPVLRGKMADRRQQRRAEKGAVTAINALSEVSEPIASPCSLGSAAFETIALKAGPTATRANLPR